MLLIPGSRSDCQAYPLKALLGHSMKGDVTASHYMQIGVERLRPWLEKYECFMLKLINETPKVSFIRTPTASPGMKDALRTHHHGGSLDERRIPGF